MEWKLETVGMDFFTSADYRCTCSATLAAPPQAIFEALTGDPAGWAAWNPGFSKKGHWTTPAPHGTGSVREVSMSGVRYTDTILVWEEPSRWAFYVGLAGAPLVRALAEEYQISPSGAGSMVQWTIAMKPRLALQALRPLTYEFLPRYFAKAMANLDRHLTGDGRSPG